MLNKFYKIFFFTSLVVTALIAMMVAFGDASRLFELIPTKIIHNSRDISTVAAAFLPIGITILCALFTLLFSIILHFTRKKEATTDTPKKISFFFYYFICLITVSLLVLFFCWLRFNILERCIDISDIIVFPLLYIACIVEASVLAALFVSLFTLWKTNKTVAFIIGAIIIFIIPANFICGEAVREASNYCRYNYTTNNYDSQYYVAEEEYDEGDYENVIEVVDDYLSFLWGDDDNIDATFEYLFNDELSSWNSDYPQSFLFVLSDFVYTLNADDEEWNSLNTDTDTKGLLRNTIRKIHRYLKDNSSEILNAFYSYEDVIYKYIPISRFNGTASEALLQQLTVAHNDLYGDNGFSRLRNIYSQMTDISHSYASEYYDDIKQYINQDYLHYFNDKDGDFYQGAAVWAYSFWARRYVEGTDDIAYTILRQINEHYEYYYHD